MNREFLERGFSRNMLKGLAVISMTVDHTAFAFLSESGSYHFLYLFMRKFGRIAFPLFCFLLVQGFLNTRNVKNYFCRIVVFACVSEIPFDLFLYQRMFSFRRQNVLFTLGISFLVLYGISKVYFSKWCIFLFILSGSVLAYFMKTDYSYLGVILVSVMYLWRNERLNQFVILCVVMGMQGGLTPWEILALPFIMLYRPEKDKERKEYVQKTSLFKRYFFYTFYPVHMLILCFMHQLII